MTVRVISKESVIYKKDIYRFGETMVVSSRVGNSLIDRGYVEKVSDTPLFSDDTTDEEEFDRLVLNDSENDKQHCVFVKDGHLYMEESEV